VRTGPASTGFKRGPRLTGVYRAKESTSAKAFRHQVGKVITFASPSNLKPSREIWDTDVS